MVIFEFDIFSLAHRADFIGHREPEHVVMLATPTMSFPVKD
jgi:hypothetical protein